jgi:hypothetical protein
MHANKVIEDKIGNEIKEVGSLNDRAPTSSIVESVIAVEEPMKLNLNQDENFPSTSINDNNKMSS